MKTLSRSTLALAAMLALPAAAHAQAYQCAVPAKLPRPRPEVPSQREPQRVIPIGGYTLAISWSPEFCHGASGAGTQFQCGGDARFGFTLHGLWPDGTGRDWPQYCKPAALLPERVIRDNLCATPSVQLLQHEYAKHGTCMNVPPADYFRRSTGLYGKLRYPDMQALSRRRGLTAGQFQAAFARANPGMSANMLRLNVDRKGWLEEVWICLDTRFRYRACPATQGGAAANRPIKIARDKR